MDYNILYEVPDVIDFYVLAVGQNCYVYKNLLVVHDINIARKFNNITAAHRYARTIEITDYRLIGVKNYHEEGRHIQKLFFIKPRASKAARQMEAARQAEEARKAEEARQTEAAQETEADEAVAVS